MSVTAPTKVVIIWRCKVNAINSNKLRELLEPHSFFRVPVSTIEYDNLFEITVDTEASYALAPSPQCITLPPPPPHPPKTKAAHLAFYLLSMTAMKSYLRTIAGETL